MSPLEIAGIAIFITVLLLGLLSIVFGLPGTLIIFFDVFLYSLATGFETIGFKVLLILALLAAAAEALEFFLSMSIAIQFGLSVKGFWASIIGAVLGAAVMTPFLFGLGAVIGSFLGGLIGVLLMELIRQGRLKPAFRAGYGAVIGRVAGTLAKGFLAVAMIIITLTNIYS